VNARQEGLIVSTDQSDEVPEDGPPVSKEGPPESPGAPFLVVGVGASAGGLEAFKEVLQNIPADAGLAFLYVQHLQANQPSLLSDILRKATPLTVRQAEQGQRLEPNHVFLIPPGADMAVEDGILRLTPRQARPVPHMPIDYLFRSLADIYKGRAVGVVLSGGGTDGTLGMKAIKGEGGITFAQDERSAEYASMPRSAVTDGWVDYVLPPAEIAGRLLQIARHPYTAPDGAAVRGDEDEGAIDKIISLLRSKTAVDFGQYKRNTIVRRVRRRMALRNCATALEYLHQLEGDATEVQNLYQDFLIRVTRFFRDEEVFELLKSRVFPALLKDRTANSPIRIWVAGCATGEEVYSLAICLLEFLGDRASNVPIKILATDVNEAALEKARAGMYIDNIELDVPAERIRRFFGKVNGHYQVGKAVRDLCVFSKHNLATDPPFSRLDLISCRNVLIYLDSALQKRVLPLLHYGLNPGGFLLLGSSETIGPFGDLFTVVDSKQRLYVRNAVGGPPPALDFGSSYLHAVSTVRRTPGNSAPAWSALDVQKEADRVVLAKYAPVGVVIDEAMTVLQFRGRTGQFLEPAPGMASLDLLKMLREGLLGPVRAAISRAKADNLPVRTEGVPLREADRMRTLKIEVTPIKVPPAGTRCFLVLFEEAEPPAAAAAPAAEPDTLRQQTLEQEVQQLRQELASTREYLQSLIEEHESACEELKSASEELLSSNEELQSTNEELQTAKEETQSANEELATLNEELHHRNFELARANNDLLNLLAAVSIPIVLVGRDLRLRRFTPMAEKILNLIPTDVGRPIGDIKPNLKVNDLAALIARVIDTLTPLEMETQDNDGHWYSLRIRPYVTLDNTIDGASVTLLDIDNLKRGLEQAQKPAAP
jgi:two-component system CheB/CheR fusion protein